MMIFLLAPMMREIARIEFSFTKENNDLGAG